MLSSVLFLLLHIYLMNTRSLVFAVEDSASVMVSTAAPTNASTQSTAAQQTKVTQRKSTPERLLYITSGPEEDYYDYDEETTLSPHSPVPMKPCHYDRCENLSPTCEEIQRKAGGNCLCPGIDGPNIKPDSPAINKVLSGDTEVTVTWCSPSSTVQSYRVLYQGPDSQVEKGPLLNASYRSYSIENLLPGTQYTICVVAINNAGESSAKFIEAEEDIERTIKGPCSNFHTTATKTSHMYIGIGVGLGALMVVMGILGILMCNRKKRKNRMDVEEEEMGVSNHYYKAGNTN